MTITYRDEDIFKYYDVGESRDSAVQCLRARLAIDPDYALAYAAVSGDAYWRKPWQQRTRMD